MKDNTGQWNIGHCTVEGNTGLVQVVFAQPCTPTGAKQHTLTTHIKYAADDTDHVRQHADAH